MNGSITNAPLQSRAEPLRSSVPRRVDAFPLSPRNPRTTIRVPVARLPVGPGQCVLWISWDLAREQLLDRESTNSYFHQSSRLEFSFYLSNGYPGVLCDRGSRLRSSEHQTHRKLRNCLGTALARCLRNRSRSERTSHMPPRAMEDKARTRNRTANVKTIGA